MDFPRTALVMGASGLVGSCLLATLLQSTRYSQVIALVRKPLLIDHPALVQLQVNFQALEADLVGIDADDVYCAFGTTIKQAGSKQAFRSIDLIPAVLAGIMVKRAGHFLLVSALGANPNSVFFYSRVKGEMEQKLLSCGYPFVTIARPSLLLGQRQVSRPLENLGAGLFTVLKPVLLGPLKQIAGVRATDVAASMLRQAEAVAKGERTRRCVILNSAAMQP